MRVEQVTYSTPKKMTAILQTLDDLGCSHEIQSELNFLIDGLKSLRNRPEVRLFKSLKSAMKDAQDLNMETDFINTLWKMTQKVGEEELYWDS